MNRLIFFFISLISFSNLISQTVPIYQWRDHLSYRMGVSVAAGNGQVYCATESGLFVFNKGDNSMERISKVTGLSDVEARVVNYNSFNNKFFIAYSNSNIDIIGSGLITNISDIKRKNIVGNKTINNVFFKNELAYICCGFGIVVLDMNRMEIADTYLIGPGGNQVNVYDITFHNNKFFAATASGVYQVSAFSNLADYNNWSIMPGLPAGKYNTITTYNNLVLTNYSRFLMSTPTVTYVNQDTIFSWNDTAWQRFPIFDPVASHLYTTQQLKTNNNQLTVVWQASVNTYDTTTSNAFGYRETGWFSANSTIRSGDVDSEGDVWMARDFFGLYCWRHGIGVQTHLPNGPYSANCNAMSTSGNNLMVAGGSVDNSYHGLFVLDGISSYTNTSWKNLKDSNSVIDLRGLYDVLNVYIDPDDENHSFASSFALGVIEFQDGIATHHYDNTNSLLQPTAGNEVRANGLALDVSKNLWVTVCSVPNSLAMKTPSGVWKNFDFSNLLNDAYFSQVIVDKYDQKWIVIPKSSNGLMVYAGGTTSAPNSTNTKVMSTAEGHGALPSSEVLCVAEDANSEIWVGTNKGITVFYSPENVFSGQNFDSQQILIEQDGHVQILLETELVQAIAVDDANRKWIGTANSGVYLMSADGTQQIYHFDESNSPLFSNDVRSIAINHKTGEVYFGTSKGILEFRGTSTEASEECGSFASFPNPVRPGYNGPIAINGLMNNSTCKITDVNGTLVWNTKSEGGQALWYGKNLNGEKVSTGVYFVFCTSEDGSCKKSGKILFVN